MAAFQALLARLNRIGLNRLTRLVFPHLPGFGVVVHRGRVSSRAYRTPVNVFTTDHGYVIALTYGRQAEWVRNVLAADYCELEHRGTHLRLTAPRLFHDETRSDIRPVERQILRLLGVADFLELQPVRAGATTNIGRCPASSSRLPRPTRPSLTVLGSGSAHGLRR